MYPEDLSAVELSDSQEIAALLASQQPPPRMPAAQRPRLNTRASRRHCQCGACPKCLENARWDRIFNEKFADPNYYKRQPVRHTSSLSWPAR